MTRSELLDAMGKEQSNLVADQRRGNQMAHQVIQYYHLLQKDMNSPAALEGLNASYTQWKAGQQETK